LKYNEISQKCRTAIKRTVIHFEESIIKQNNLGRFFRYANSKLNSKRNVGPLRMNDGSLTIDPTGRANLLSDYFYSVSTVDNNRCPSNDAPNKGDSIKPRLENIIFNTYSVRRAIKKLKANSSGGPDTIPPMFTKNCCEHLVFPLAYIFEVCFNASYVPPLWLQGYITPIFKNGDSTSCSNYRPICLTSVFLKIMEAIIKDRLMSYLVENGYITSRQHAFIAKHSTVTNLLDSTSDWVLAIQKKIPCDTIFVDFSRAFDSVVHSKLIYKLQNIGISGKLLSWITVFITCRLQCVVLENHYSEWKSVISGVPQGSVLGPILFIVFINDISDIFNDQINFSLYADDLKLYSEINTNDDTVQLQKSLCNLEIWCNEWQLSVNISKTHVLHFGRNNPNVPYYYGNQEVSIVNSVCDLGVDIDSNCSFAMHINRTVSKAFSRVGMILKGFRSKDITILKQAFVTYVRPLLEYASTVWSPIIKKHITAIESVQRYFTKQIPSLKEHCYEERLAILGFETLELRRLKFDLLLYYKSLNNLVPWTDSRFFTSVNELSQVKTRSDKSKLLKPIYRNKIYEGHLYIRGIDCWNNLPDLVVNSKSVLEFKRNLNRTDLSHHLLYDPN